MPQGSSDELLNILHALIVEPEKKSRDGRKCAEFVYFSTLLVAKVVYYSSLVGISQMSTYCWTYYVRRLENRLLRNSTGMRHRALCIYICIYIYTYIYIDRCISAVARASS